MDLLTLAALCGPWVAPATTLSVVRVESAGQPFAIHDNTSHRSFVPTTLSDAEHLAAALIRAGHRLDLGLMQISYDIWFVPTRMRLDQAFNPCINIAFGTTILSAAYARELGQHLSASEALGRALSIYNSGDAFRARDYANTVLKFAHLSYPKSAMNLAATRASK